MRCLTPMQGGHLHITLDPSDTYTVAFWRVRGPSCKEIESLSFVYADQLRAVVEKRTGLRLSL